MGFTRFLLIPVILFLLISAYLRFVDMLATGIVSIQLPIKQGSSGGEVIGIGTAVTVQVIRPYFFGLIELPLYAPGIGNIARIHETFFWSLGILTIVLIVLFAIIERREKRMVRTPSLKRIVGYDKPKTGLRLVKAIGIGALFGFVAFLISGDNSSLPLGLLVAYLEFKQS